MAYGPTWLRSMYFALPPALRNHVATVYGWRERQLRYGAFYAQSLKFLQESQYWSNAQLYEFQQKTLTQYLEQVLPATPYYRRRDVYRPSGDLASYPILTKQEVRLHSRQLISEDVQREQCRWGQTSGTTGTPLRFPLTLKCFQREYAFRALHYSWSGVNLDERPPIAICAGHPVASHRQAAPPYWVYDRANNWLILSSYHLSQKNLAAYVRELERFQPVLLAGYPSSLYLLALAYQRHGATGLRLRGVFTGSETLLAFQRAAMEQAFGTKVFNWYGNSEMCANIVECEYGEMHLKLEHSFVEVLDVENRPCKPGASGRLICTGFGNHAFPLIRYEIGDVVTLSPETTSRCGRGGTLVTAVEGRTEDYIVTPDGKLVGRLDHLFKGKKNVVEAQVVQHCVEEIIIRIVPSPDFTSSDELEIRQEAVERLGDSIRISFEYVDRLHRGRNGKCPFIVSSLDRGEVLRSVFQL
jgi:phenylacetate-CoA ligase